MQFRFYLCSGISGICFSFCKDEGKPRSSGGGGLEACLVRRFARICRAGRGTAVLDFGKRRQIRSRAKIGPVSLETSCAGTGSLAKTGGRALTIEPNDRGLLVLVPCLNEQGSIAQVVGDVRRVLPDVPVLVVDDSSGDGTVAVAKAAGAHVLSLPHHLGLGGAVQAGYKLAFELGFQYVIRVDGDGQHFARGYSPGI